MITTSIVTMLSFGIIGLIIYEMRQSSKYEPHIEFYGEVLKK